MRRSPLQTYTDSFSSFSRSKQFFNSVQLIIGAVLAGYTAQSIPTKYMEWASHPIGQFLIYYLLFNQSHSSTIPRTWIFIDALIFTIIMNIIMHFINKHNKLHHQEQEKKEDTTPSYLLSSTPLSV